MTSSPCRVCAKVNLGSSLTLNLFRKSSKNVKTLIRLNIIVGIEMKQRKDMPDFICADCLLRLEEAFEFRLECRRAQTLLRQSFVQKGTRKTSKHKQASDNSIENCLVENNAEPQNSTPSTGTEVNDVVYPEVVLHEDAATVDPFESVKTKTEIDISTNYKLRSKESSESAKDEAMIPIAAIKVDRISDEDDNKSFETFNARLTSSDHSDDEDWSPENNEKNNKPAKRTKKTLNTEEISKVSTGSSKVRNKTGHRKVERSKTKKVRSKTKPDINLSNDEKIAKYICEMCGQTFNVMHYFQSHVNRHKGEQTFACEICPEKYYTQQSLKRHMLKHAGAQPNACRYCPRRFLDCSAKVRHERMHTNDRPYKCTYCGKGFTSNYVLKNHVLTHTGERPFSCKICQRSFIQKKHLVTHYKSTTHKQNEEKAKEVC